MGKHTQSVGISGRGPLKRLSSASLILAMPGARGVLRHVPPEHVFGEHVQCVCGANHELREVAALYREDCGRWFLRTFNAVLCYREPDGAEIELGPCSITVKRVDDEWVEVAA